MNPRHAQVALRAGHQCEYCHAPEAIFNFPFEVEHIAPLSQEGTGDETNLALSCRSCNLRKAVHISGFDPQSQTTVRLFHPRQDNWNEHVQVDEGSAQIIGLTASGRATAVRLDMNSQSQRLARRQWMWLGLFP